MNRIDRSTGPTQPGRSEVLQGVIAVIAEQMSMDSEKIRESDALDEDLGCDSLDLVEISMLLEDRFSISVPDEFSDRVKTVGQVVDGVTQLLPGCQSR